MELTPIVNTEPPPETSPNTTTAPNIVTNDLESNASVQNIFVNQESFFSSIQNGSINALLTIANDDSTKSGESLSNIEDIELCRICRWNRSDMILLKCPCLCKGTVGFIHLQCLKRWMLSRRISRCEICKSHFNVPEEKLNLKRMLRNFFTCRCFGNIVKNLLFCASLLPLTHIVLQQVLTCMERLNVNPNEAITIQEVLLGTFALLTSSALFFHFFEFMTTRILHCRHIIRRWWLFGNGDEFDEIEIDDPFDFI